MYRKTFFLFFFFLVSFSGFAQTDTLFRKISRLDSVFFAAYNSCDMKMQESMYADSLEFFHDKSGLNTSKKDILESTKKYVCGKVTRELVPGSLEISPLPGYGAVEIGQHIFHNSEEKNAKPHPSRFVIVWKEKNGSWQITRIISLH